MSFFTELVKRVGIDSENSVTIRKLTYGQRQAAISKASRLNPLTQETNIDFGLLRLEQLAACVVGWDGPGFEGRPASRANVEALPPEVAEKIEAALDAFAPPLSSDEKKVSGAA